MDLFDVSPAVAISALVIATGILVLAMVYFIRSAPPTTLTISSGAPGSIFQKNALKYAAILEANGIKVNVLTSKGSTENLARLLEPSSHVDVGIVQTGNASLDSDRLFSLGSISYQPLLIFYRGAPIELLSALAGKTVAVGALGSGTRKFALTLLEANGIKSDGPTKLVDWDADQATRGLLAGKIDAAFVMSESASTDELHELLRDPEVHLFSFKQATAYSRKIDYFNVLNLPEGAIDFGRDLPPHDISLLGPTVELIAVKTLHPALSDLLLEAAVQVHNHPGIFQHRGEFPNGIEHSIPISDDATRFYKSGKSFLYRYLPFWLASLISRIVLVFLPTVVVLIPALRSVPAFFRWRMTMKIRRRYRELLEIEKDLLRNPTDFEREKMRDHFDRIDAEVNKMKVPPSFADQFYGLRGHIDYVRNLVVEK